MSLPASVPWRLAPTSGRDRVATNVRHAGLSRAVSLDTFLVLALMIGALILALTHPWSHAYVGEAQYGDAAYWDFGGESWARGFVGTKTPDIRPGYSVFLGIVYTLFGPKFQNAFVAQALLYALGVGMVYGIGKRIAGALTGVLAALLFALDPFMWEWTATSTTELLGSITGLAALYFLTGGVRSGRWAFLNLALFGFFLAYANIVRPITLPFVAPALLVVLLWFRGPRLRRLALVATAITAMALTLLPSVVYQYVATGDPGLSSNSAANLYAASSPKWQTWDPAMYEEVTVNLNSRGLPLTPENVNAEFTRLTIQNYLEFPQYQISRMISGLHAYGAFEGELERPFEYGLFWRPRVVIVSLALAGLLLFWNRRRPPWWTGLPGLALTVGLAVAAQQALNLLIVAALVASPRILRRPNARVITMVLVALYWLITGFLAILTSGVAGFLLHRLYTQVEPMRTILLAAGTTGLAGLLLGRERRAWLLCLRWLRQRTPHLPVQAKIVPALAGGAALLLAVFGAGSLVMANLAPVSTSQLLPVPGAAELSALGAALRLPEAPRYIDAAGFDPWYVTYRAGKLPERPVVYAVPGQITRFLWQLSDQDRTLFWFVFSDRPPVAARDRNLLTIEAPGYLTEPALGNRLGMLIIVETGAYFDLIGDIAQQNVLGARAFVPWDATQKRFNYESVVTFPLVTRLYDHARFEAAAKVGKVAEAGLVRVVTADRSVRAVELQPSPDGPTRQALIIYRNLWIPANSTFQAWVALHPGQFNHADLGAVHVELSIGSDIVVDMVLDPMSRAQQMYTPLEADLTSFGDRTADVTVRVWGSDPAATELPDVLVGEPRITLSP